MRASTSASASISRCRQASARARRARRKLAHRLRALRLGLGEHEVGEAFDGGEIEPPVLKGAAGEFARLGRAEARQAAERGEHGGDHRAAAVQVQLGHVLAGLGVRPGKPEHQRLVEQRCRAGSRSRRSAARRGSGSLPPSASSASPARGPEMRTTAIAAGGRPEERAKMVDCAGSVITVTEAPRALTVKGRGATDRYETISTSNGL